MESICGVLHQCGNLENMFVFIIQKCKTSGVATKIRGHRIIFVPPWRALFTISKIAYNNFNFILCRACMPATNEKQGRAHIFSFSYHSSDKTMSSKRFPIPVLNWWMNEFTKNEWKSCTREERTLFELVTLPCMHVHTLAHCTPSPISCTEPPTR